MSNSNSNRQQLIQGILDYSKDVDVQDSVRYKGISFESLLPSSVAAYRNYMSALEYDLECHSYKRFVSRFPPLDGTLASRDDVEVADHITRYYRNKIGTEALKKSLTPFRKDMYALLIGEAKVVKENIGILYMLPYFYYEDLARGDIIDFYNQSRERTSSRMLSFFNHIQLVPFKQIFRARRTGTVYEFWFKGSLGAGLENELFMFSLAATDKMLGFFKNLISRHDTIELRCSIKEARFPGVPIVYKEIDRFVFV